MHRGGVPVRRGRVSKIQRDAGGADPLGMVPIDVPDPEGTDLRGYELLLCGPEAGEGGEEEAVPQKRFSEAEEQKHKEVPFVIALFQI